MSVSQLLVDNDLKIFVNTTDRGVNLNGTFLTSSGTPYRFILPINPPINPNSVLAVSSIIDDNILTYWIDPTGGPTLPIDIINCNTLNALLEVNTAQLEINNLISSGSVQFITNSTTDTQYVLPNDIPTQDSVLVSNNAGVLRWVNPTIEPVPIEQAKILVWDYPGIQKTIIQGEEWRPTPSILFQVPNLGGSYFEVTATVNCGKTTGTDQSTAWLYFNTDSDPGSQNFTQIGTVRGEILLAGGSPIHLHVYSITFWIRLNDNQNSFRLYPYFENRAESGTTDMLIQRITYLVKSIGSNFTQIPSP